MGEGLRILSHLEDTTDEKIDAIARDVNVELNQGVNNLDAKADKLVKDVKAETAEMRKIIESAEFGIPAPSLASMTAVSDEAGINVTVTATDATVDYSSNKAVLATTKGVMVRYKDGSYPANKTDGELAFIDEDLFTVNTDGNRVAKAKTHLVVGLTKDHTYYFSAFPYTQQGAHNERLGTGNVAKMKYVGNLSTLTVNVSRDVEIFDLGEVTATLTPTAGGTPLVQKRTGDGAIVFADVKAGKYILSFSSVANHKTPSALSVTLQGGTPKTLQVNYTPAVGALNDCSWETISKIAQLGLGSKYFSIGDKKTTKIAQLVGSFSETGYYAVDPTFVKDANVVLVGINTFENAESGTRYNLTFIPEIPNMWCCGMAGNIWANDGFGDKQYASNSNNTRNQINKIYATIFPDVADYIVKTKHKTMRRGNSKKITELTDDFIFIPSATNVGYKGFSEATDDAFLPYFTTVESQKILIKATSASSSSLLRTTADTDYKTYENTGQYRIDIIKSNNTIRIGLPEEEPDDTTGNVTFCFCV